MKLQIPSDDVNSVADWAELYVLSTNTPLAKLTLINYIKTNLPEIKLDSDREALATSVFTELKVRSNELYGPSVHFTISGNVINPIIKLEDFPELALCLIFALKGVAVQKGRNNGTKYFEQISNIAVKTYIGESTLVGFPNASKLNRQIEDACKVLFEPKGHENPRSSDKDGGVDIIAWNSFNDQRTNKILVLIQCGAGKHFGKKKPINIKKWERWVHWAFTPLTGMTTPKIIRDSNEWQDLSDYYSLIMDRPRIARFVYNSPNIKVGIRKKVKNWCLKNIS